MERARRRFGPGARRLAGVHRLQGEFVVVGPPCSRRRAVRGVQRARQLGDPVGGLLAAAQRLLLALHAQQRGDFLRDTTRKRPQLPTAVTTAWGEGAGDLRRRPARGRQVQRHQARQVLRRGRGRGGQHQRHRGERSEHAAHGSAGERRMCGGALRRAPVFNRSATRLLPLQRHLQALGRLVHRHLGAPGDVAGQLQRHLVDARLQRQESPLVVLRPTPDRQASPSMINSASGGSARHHEAGGHGGGVGATTGATV